jgi:predicted RNase H-like HicB family nuclease
LHKKSETHDTKSQGHYQNGINKINFNTSRIMERVMVEIEYAGGNYCAHAPLLLGCVSTGSTLGEIKRNIKEAIALHVEGSIEDGEGDLIPEVFKGEYELVYKLSAEASLNTRRSNAAPRHARRKEAAQSVMA